MRQTMSSLRNSHATAPISPALVANALDHLALVPGHQPLDPDALLDLTRRVSRTEMEAITLLVRIRAAGIAMADPRWPKWSRYFRSNPPETYRVFDAVVLDIIATLPLDTSLRFVLDDFFDALLGNTPVASGN
jgi:hypothetical protein